MSIQSDIMKKIKTLINILIVFIFISCQKEENTDNGSFTLIMPAEKAGWYIGSWNSEEYNPIVESEGFANRNWMNGDKVRIYVYFSLTENKVAPRLRNAIRSNDTWTLDYPLNSDSRSTHAQIMAYYYGNIELPSDDSLISLHHVPVSYSFTSIFNGNVSFPENYTAKLEEMKNITWLRLTGLLPNQEIIPYFTNRVKCWYYKDYFYTDYFTGAFITDSHGNADLFLDCGSGECSLIIDDHIVNFKPAASKRFVFDFSQ